MAKIELQHGTDPQLRAMAERIIRVQLSRDAAARYTPCGQSSGG